MLKTFSRVIAGAALLIALSFSAFGDIAVPLGVQEDHAFWAKSEFEDLAFDQSATKDAPVTAARWDQFAFGIEAIDIAFAPMAATPGSKRFLDGSPATSAVAAIARAEQLGPVLTHADVQSVQQVQELLARLEKMQNFLSVIGLDDRNEQ